jgi:hypothetical protein
MRRPLNSKSFVFVAAIACFTRSNHTDAAESLVENALADMPAVSALNGKLGYGGGSMNSAEGHNVDGSLSLPMGKVFGFQADGLYSRISDLDFYGGAGHFFWRKPELGLIGITGGYIYRDGVETYQAGAEAEYYVQRFTFGLFAGVGSIDYENPAPFIETNPTKFVGRVSAGFYPLNDLRLTASYTTAFDNHLAKGEAEYLTPFHGLAVTAEVARGDHGYDHWLIGARWYFGAKKSLRERHRQDDPPSLMPQILQGLGLYGAEFNREMKHWFQENYSENAGGGSFGVIISHPGGYGSVDWTSVIPPNPMAPDAEGPF